MSSTPINQQAKEAQQMHKNLTIDGVEYAPIIHTTDDMVIVRSRDAGVFAGRVISREGAEVTLADARRIWYWDGAATLSELAVCGTSKPGTCKFPVAVPEIVVLGVCEVIPMTEQAVASIAAVPVWSES